MLSLAAFFTMEAGNYENFNFTAENATFVRNIILALCAGVVIAALCTMYQKYVPGAFVRAILKAEAYSEETAKTVAELGFEKNIFIRIELRFGTMLLKYLRFIPPKNGEEKKSARPDFTTARFYIPEEFKYRADARYETKGNGPLQFILAVCVSLLMAILAIKLLPLLLSFVDAIL